MTRRDARLVRSPLLGLPTMHEQAGALAPVPAVQARLSAQLLQRGQKADWWWHQHQVPTAAYRQVVAAFAQYTVSSCSVRQQRQGEQHEEVDT